ncbi:hypothetical protein D3C87_1930530 [compost metagenome]
MRAKYSASFFCCLSNLTLLNSVGFSCSCDNDLLFSSMMLKADEFLTAARAISNVFFQEVAALLSV